MADTDQNVKVPAGSEVSPHQVAEAKEEMKKAIRGAHEVLFIAKTVFPFNIFPDTITVDRVKLTITTKFFFKVEEVTSIRIEDILNITANTGPFFGSIKIVSRVLTADEQHINYLWKNDALRLKRILQGYVIVMQKDIDVTPLPTKDLRKMLDDLGKDDHVPNTPN